MRSKKGEILWSGIAASIFMMLTLLWLTVSTPFVYAAQIQKSLVEKQQCENDTEEECGGGSWGNTAEEKNEKGVNTLSEYLYDLQLHDYAFTTIIKYYKCHAPNEYMAFHPELFSPPPEA